MNIRNETPSKSTMALVNKVLSSSKTSCDSPFSKMPHVSTPPSRFAKIMNPFEHHLIERLHLPTFSPNVFAQVSTPKTEEKFKWTIDDISSLKPADIDEATVSQHVSHHDPNVESMVQEKIEHFFKEKIIVPSPMSVDSIIKPLVIDSMTPPRLKPQLCDGIAQTVLTLPPKLPSALEELLKPYFTFTENQQKCTNNSNDPNSSLYRKLFQFDENEEPQQHHQSIESSPPLSTGLSPIPLSPVFTSNKVNDSPTIEIPEFRDCELSPIGRSPRLSRSACRLSFSRHMSIDHSLLVPDIQNLPNCSNRTIFEPQSVLGSIDFMEHSATNWDMEYKRVSILSESPDIDEEEPEIDEPIDMSNSSTPHSKLFSSQRKRLSDSFKDEDYSKDVEMGMTEPLPFNSRRSKGKLNLNDDITDIGYCTGEGSTWDKTNMYASTPTKHND